MADVNRQLEEMTTYPDPAVAERFKALRARLEAVEAKLKDVSRRGALQAIYTDQEQARAERAEAALATARRDAAHIAATMFVDAGITAKREHAAGRMIAAAILAQDREVGE